MRSSISLTVLSVFLFGFATYAQKELPPEGGAPKNFVLPNKVESRLDNGLKSTLVQYGTIPKATISLIIKTGNVHEGPEEVWLADLTGEFLKQGSRSMGFNAIADSVAAMGGEITLTVRPDQTTLSGAVLSEHAADFIRVIGEMVMSPAFPEKELARLKGDLRRNLAVQKAVPQSQAEEAFQQAVFPNSPYGRLFPTQEMIEGFSLADVKEFYDKNFGAKRSVLYVVGKFDEEKVQQAIRQAFENWKTGPDVKYPEQMAIVNPDTVIIDRKSAPQTTLIIGLPTAGPGSNEYVQQIITNSLLGGSFGSRITSNIRENKGYTYSPYSAIVNTKGGSVWKEVADVTAEYTAASLKEIEQEIHKLQKNLPTADELKGIKNYEAGTFVLRNSVPAGIISQLNFLDLYSLPDSYLNNMVKNLHAVTPAQVSGIARKYHLTDKMTVVMVGDREQIEKQFAK